MVLFVGANSFIMISYYPGFDNLDSLLQSWTFPSISKTRRFYWVFERSESHKIHL